MAGLKTAAQNAKDFVPTPVDSTTDLSSRRQLLREITHTEYLCTEYPHVSIKFLPGGILQIFSERKQPYVRNYSLRHVSKTDWRMTVTPHLTNYPGELVLNVMKNHLTLTNEKGEVLHLNKLNLKAYDNSK